MYNGIMLWGVNFLIAVFLFIALSFQNLFSANLASLPPNSVHPRTITPNGDQINDLCFFVFESQSGAAAASGSIYDLKATKVADVAKTNITVPGSTVLAWDGKDEFGAVVTAGLYLYKIEVGGKNFVGTISVAR